MKSWLLNWGFIIVFAFAGQNDTTLSFDTSEGTLISVDISPNGKTIAFDLLGIFVTILITIFSLTISISALIAGKAFVGQINKS